MNCNFDESKLSLSHDLYKVHDLSLLEYEENSQFLLFLQRFRHWLTLSIETSSNALLRQRPIVKHSAEKKANVFEQLPLFYCMTTSGQAFTAFVSAKVGLPIISFLDHNITDRLQLLVIKTNFRWSKPSKMKLSVLLGAK